MSGLRSGFHRGCDRVAFAREFGADATKRDEQYPPPDAIARADTAELAALVLRLVAERNRYRDALFQANTALRLAHAQLGAGEERYIVESILDVAVALSDEAMEPMEPPR